MMVPSERDDVLVGNDFLKEALGALEAEALQGHGGLAGVLEMNTQVRSAGLAGLGRVSGFGRVLPHVCCFISP